MEDPSQVDGKREFRVQFSILVHDTDQIISYTNGLEEQLLCSVLPRSLSV